MYKKASKLYHKELDIIELVRKVRDAESFRRLFLNRQQQMLLKLGAQNVVASDSSDSKNEKEKDRIELLSHQIHHKKTSVAIFSLGQVNRILKGYTTNNYHITDFDIRLMTNFYEQYATSQLKREVEILMDPDSALKKMTTLRAQNVLFANLVKS